MFEVGFTELVMIALVALLVVGPERLPELVRTTGRWIGRFKRIAGEVRAEIERETALAELRQAQQDLRNTTSERIGVDVPTSIAPPPGSVPTATEHQGSGKP